MKRVDCILRKLLDRNRAFVRALEAKWSCHSVRTAFIIFLHTFFIKDFWTRPPSRVRGASIDYHVSAFIGELGKNSAIRPIEMLLREQLYILSVFVRRKWNHLATGNPKLVDNVQCAIQSSFLLWRLKTSLAAFKAQKMCSFSLFTQLTTSPPSDNSVVRNFFCFVCAIGRVINDWKISDKKYVGTAGHAHRRK